MTAGDRDVAAGRSGWTAPAIAAALGWASVPLLFVAPLSFVISWCLAVGAALAALTVFTTESAGLSRRCVAALGLLGAVVAVALTVLPFVLQN